MALVRGAPRGLDSSSYKAQVSPPFGSRSELSWTMSALQELHLADLELRPSSGGVGSLVAYLTFEDLGHSGQEISPHSRTALALAVKVDPKELPLLSGLIGRSFTASWRQLLGVADTEHLCKELIQEREQHQQLKWVLEDLASRE